MQLSSEDLLEIKLSQRAFFIVTTSKWNNANLIATVSKCVNGSTGKEGWMVWANKESIDNNQPRINFLRTVNSLYTQDDDFMFFRSQSYDTIEELLENTVIEEYFTAWSALFTHLHEHNVHSSGLTHIEQFVKEQGNDRI